MNDCGFKFTIIAKKGRVLLQSLCRSVGELEAKLQFERERREALEGDMDQLRKQLQQTTSGEVKGQDQNWQSKFLTPVAGGRIESMGVTPP